MIMNPDLVFRIANIFFLVGTILLLYAIIKNRNVLRGFQPIGSLLTLCAMSWIQFNYYQMEFWENFWLSFPTWGLWLLATIFSVKNNVHGWLERRKGEQSVFKSLGYKNKKDFEKKNRKQEYICENCENKWQMRIRRGIVRCPKCGSERILWKNYLIWEWAN